MRICPKCKRQFPDNTLFCPDDGKALVDRSDDVDASNAGKSSPLVDATLDTLDAGMSGGDLDDTVIDTTVADIEEAKRQAKELKKKGSMASTNPSHQQSGRQQPSGRQKQSAQQQRPKSATPTQRGAPPDLTSKSSTPSKSNAAPSKKSKTSPAHGPVDTTDLVGESLFGQYTITEKLGEGGMGSVYLAKQDSIDQSIAVKVLHEESAKSEELVQRFHREARVVSMLTHPNIIRVFIFGRTGGGLLYLAMEYVQGETLRGLLDEKQLDEMRVIKIMKQICSGLSEAHDLGIIHRDLKPDNVLLTEWRGEADFAKILDFGIAKLKQPQGPEEQKNLTQAGIVYGTPEYLSPEQAQAFDLDHRTDIYSLGCILYEFMTGKVPFRASTPVKILTAHVFTEVKPPSELAPGRVSPTMENIILKAMAKDPEDRFQDALEMFEALVAREQEIVRQKGLGNRAGYVPGMELTGMYSAVDYAEEQADLSGSVAPTADTARPQIPATQTSQPAASDSGSSTRMVIYLLIAATAMLFIVLLVAIGFFVLT